MTGYLVSFSVYTLAMIGIIFGALFVFKTFSNKCFSKKSSIIQIEDSMALAPRKTLYIVNIENERFLVAADAERTSLVSKLGATAQPIQSIPIREDKSSKLKSFDGVTSMSEFASLSDFRRELNREPVMKELARKLSAI